MTATLVAMLVEDGELNWTTTLGEPFADTVNPMHPAWEKVTLRQVLAHRAGLRHEPGSLAQVLNELVGRPHRAPLGTRPHSTLLQSLWASTTGTANVGRFTREIIP